MTMLHIFKLRSGLLPALLFVILAWVPFAEAKAVVDRSDLNGDGAVDTQDLEIFADLYFEPGAGEAEWCVFLESVSSNQQYFRSVVSDNMNRYLVLLNVAADTYDCGFAVIGSDSSDLNRDGVVDLADLAKFSVKYLDTPWENVDWCVFYGTTVAGAYYDGRSTKYYLKNFTLLLEFINAHFDCGEPLPPPQDLFVENAPKFLTRIADALSSRGRIYISDPGVGSVYIYDEVMTIKGEIKGLNKPLGVAVDSLGHLLVGNDGRDNIEAYDPTTGELLAVFGEGLVKMPTAITIDGAGNIYVTDSRSDNVRVFDSAYNPIRVIGRSGKGDDTLTFPMDAEIIGAEIFVADQGNYRVQVFDLDGNWVESITFEGTDGENCNWFTGVCAIPGAPPFTKVQALSRDSLGRLHVLDNFAAAVTIFDSADRTYVTSYGEYGLSAGKLRVPMDVVVSSSNMAIVTAGDGSRVEMLPVP
jgi:DNA-binding beta-propeller fold protein YncE